MVIKALITIAAIAIVGVNMAHSQEKPTVVLVHGAFADSSSWSKVIAKLEQDGYPVAAASNPLRSVTGDGAYVRKIVDSLPGDVILVGHSYGGSVINEVAAGNAKVRSLVFVAAFAPDIGATALR